MSLPQRLLADLRAGDALVIQQIGGAESFRRRLYELGFLPGARVEVVRRLPFHGPLDVNVRGYRLGLRLEDARRVLGSPAK